MNEITLFKSPEEMEKQKSNQIIWRVSNKQTFMGYVYAVEFGDHVKIGCTQCPVSRIRTLVAIAKNYCFTDVRRIAFTLPHTNFLKNEKYLHSVFANKRIENGELFDNDFESAIDALLDLELKNDSNMLEERIEIAKRSLASVIFGVEETEELKEEQVNMDTILESLTELYEENKALRVELESLIPNAPEGAKELFAMIEKYCAAKQRKLIRTLYKLPFQEQIHILKDVKAKKVLPDFLKTIAEGK